jgi:hypothetical protein
MQRSLRVVVVTLALLACALPLAAQTTLVEYQLAGPLGEIGGNVGDAGDVDGDGVHDLLVGGTTGVSSLLLTFSGADGSKLPGSFPAGGGSGIGDLNGDGLRDVVSVDSVALRAYSRATGGVLWGVANISSPMVGGRNVAVLPDIDGDGVDDVAFGEPQAGPASEFGNGIVRLLSGSDGSLIHMLSAPPGSSTFGIASAPFADADGDGVGDLLVGQIGYFVGGAQVGRALLYSTSTFTSLAQIVGDRSLESFGGGVLDGGDLDGDAVHDIVVKGFTTTAARVFAYSGATLVELWASGPVPSTSLVAVGDVDGDGRTDLVAAHISGPAGLAVVLSGADGSALGSFPGHAPFSFASIAGPGDLDGDGQPELLVGVPTNPFQEPGSSPRADIVSLPDGALLSSLSNLAGNMHLGLDVALAGDLDADGLADIGVIGDTHVAAFSRVSGAPLFVTKLPVVPALQSDGSASALAAPGDLSGDGVPDLVVGDGNETNVTKGRVFLVSGDDGALLQMLEGVQSQENFGHFVVADADRNGDGVRDVWVTSEFLTVAGTANAGEVRLYSGANWSVLTTLHGAVLANGAFGSSLSVGGDIDGDGVAEIAVGSHDNVAGPNTGALYVFSGATGVVLRRIDGAFLSNGVTGLITGDADGDDIPDILAVEVCWNSCQGRARLLSGRTGVVLWTAVGSTANSNLGRRLANVGDVNGDGRADVAVSEFTFAPQPSLRILSGLDGSALDTLTIEANSAVQTGSNSAGLFDAGGCSDLLIGQPNHAGNGSVQVLASSKGGIHGFVDVGFAKAGSNGQTPSLRGYGGLAAGQVVTVTARHALPGAPGAWFIGLSAGNLPFKQGVLVPNPAGPFFVFPVAANGNGVFSISAPNPASVFAGLSLWHQMWFQDVAALAGVSATNGMKETFK